MITGHVTLTRGAGWAELEAGIAAVGELEPQLAQRALKVLLHLVETVGDRIVNGDPRAAIAGELELPLSLDFSGAEAAFLAALRAGDLDAIRAHVSGLLPERSPAAAYETFAEIVQETRAERRLVLRAAGAGAELLIGLWIDDAGETLPIRLTIENCRALRDGLGRLIAAAEPASGAAA